MRDTETPQLGHLARKEPGRKMENQDLRPKGVFSCILTFDATNVP